MSPSQYYAKKLQNPFADFLRAIPRGKALADALKNAPPAPDDEVRCFTLHERLTLNTTLSEFHVPLPRDTDLAEEILQLLTATYYARIPSPASVAQRKEAANLLVERLKQGSSPTIQALGRSLIGPPGSGKTWTLSRILNNKFIPQVVALDPKTNPLVLSKMVTWVRVEAPSTRKISALVNSLITAILTATGENYKPLLRGSIGVQINRLAMLCQDYSVGLIVVDELQHILRKNDEPDIELVDFLVELSNAVHVPLLLVGTPKSEFVISSALRQARRSFGPRFTILDRKGRSWPMFAKELIKYQFTRAVASYDEIESGLYHHSQGLPAITVALFQYAQHRALMVEDETQEPTRITPAIIDEVFAENMSTIAPMIEAIRNNDENALLLFDDLKFDRKRHRELLQERARGKQSKKKKTNTFHLTMSKAPSPLKWRPDAN